jgi:hypothetical protein
VSRQAARQSRNRATKEDRKIEDRKMKRHPIFLSSIFLSLYLSAAPLQWRGEEQHLSIRGEPWVYDGDLAMHVKSIGRRLNNPNVEQ